jgi:hypothetical protein
MKKSWVFTNNPFLTATIGSYPNAYQISVFHLSALNAAKTDPFFAALLATYQPTHDAFVAAYNQWTLQAGLQQGQTETMKQLFKDLNVNIKTWDVAIQNVYPDSTPTYKGLLPHKRVPFQSGTQNDRLTAIQNLIDAIGSDTNLSKLKTTITAFQTTIVAAIGKQKTALQKTVLDSDDVETSRIAICIAQYANLGAMMLQFATTPEVIEPYFDLKNIRQEIQTVFTKELKPSEVYFIAKRSFKADDVLEFDNIGNTEILFYIADKKDATTGTVIINVPAGENKSVVASELGDINNLHFLLAKNSDAAIKGSFEAYLE